MEKRKAPTDKAQAVAGAPPQKPSVPTASASLPPLFRRIDWITLVVTTLLVFLGYYLTLAPELTLEDSGELATGSFYAGIPHPPGYPVWTIYTYFWSLLPFGNVAWRVALGEALGGALACGLLGFMVSRGSSMFMEGIAALKDIDRRWESAICVVSGFVAGMLLGFNGFMWSQSVIVEVYSFSVLSLMGTLCALMRWIYAPRQRRYLYLSFFIFGICFTNHQTLLLAAMGLEVAVIAADFRVGRDVLLGNSLVYLLLFVATKKGMTTLNEPALWLIFNFVGLSSLVGLICLTFITRRTVENWIAFARDLLFVASTGYVIVLLAFVTELLPPLNMHSGVFLPMHLGGVAAMSVCYWLTWLRKKPAEKRQVPVHMVLFALSILFILFIIPISAGQFAFVKTSLERFWTLVGPGVLILAAFLCLTGRRTEIKVVYLIGLMWVLGAGFYFYMPIAGMTIPPMEWGYPRTVEGFFHALTRGQYESAHPTNVLQDPARFFDLVTIVIQGVGNEFNWVYTMVAFVPFLFFLRLQKRERAWLIGLLAVYLFMAILLAIMLNPGHDRQSMELNRVFFTASHAIIAMFIGYGIALAAAAMLANYAKFRIWGFAAGGIAVCLAIVELASQTLAFYGEHPDMNWLQTFFLALGNAFHKDQYALPIYANILLLVMALVFLANLILFKAKPHMIIALAVFAVMPAHSIFCNWSDNEQRHHWFGYWFGHDMFTPPFTAPDGKLSYDPNLREQAAKGPNGNLVYPEMTRDTILFGGTDPGRFCPTYMIFCDSFIPDRCKPVFDQRFDRRDVYIITQNALADGTYLEYIRSQYFRSAQKDPPFFQELLRTKDEKSPETNFSTNFLARLAYKTLDVPLTKWGANVEARRRREGVYPPKEIYTPSPEDLTQAFSEYTADAARRKQHDEQFPNEPRQIKAGEEVRFLPDGRVQVAGQTAVMSINGLLTKVIFDHNPTNDFFVEESFPLDWMFPYLTPYGIIMKINRQPLPEITDEICRRDHEFWSKYSERLIGNWITYDTSIKQIVDFSEKVYLRHNYAGFTGDRKFVRDDQGQKAFSKLRSAIGGIYSWRLGLLPGVPTPPQFLPKTDAERDRLMKEAEFAYRQAFAFCPYSPEVMYRYVNLLMTQLRFDDALLIAETCRKFDPENGSIISLVRQLQGYVKQPNASLFEIQNQAAQMETDLRANSNDFTKALDLIQKYVQLGQNDRAFLVLERILANPQAPADLLMNVTRFCLQFGNPQKAEAALDKLVQLNPGDLNTWGFIAGAYARLNKPQKVDAAVARMEQLGPTQLPTWLYAAQAYQQLNQLPKVESALEKLVQVAPNQPETWYDLASAKAALGKTDALQVLRRAIDLSDKRLAQNTNSGETKDLRAIAEKDPQFNSLRSLPAYKAAVAK